MQTTCLGRIVEFTSREDMDLAPVRVSSMTSTLPEACLQVAASVLAKNNSIERKVQNNQITVGFTLLSLTWIWEAVRILPFEMKQT